MIPERISDNMPDQEVASMLEHWFPDASTFFRQLIKRFQELARHDNDYQQMERQLEDAQNEIEDLRSEKANLESELETSEKVPAKNESPCKCSVCGSIVPT